MGYHIVLVFVKHFQANSKKRNIIYVYAEYICVWRKILCIKII